MRDQLVSSCVCLTDSAFLSLLRPDDELMRLNHLHASSAPAALASAPSRLPISPFFFPERPLPRFLRGLAQRRLLCRRRRARGSFCGGLFRCCALRRSLLCREPFGRRALG